MKILISAVGDTDPIRGNHDGPLVHISRVYRPEKIILIYSETMYRKKEQIEIAIRSISESYAPEIIAERNVIKDEEVFRFDRMFEVLQEIVLRNTNITDEFLLNLSSGTPQIISALFTINKINDFDIKAVQVSTPIKSSNKNNLDDGKDLSVLIAENKDQTEWFERRTIEEDAEKFSHSLIKRNIKGLIRSYDYQGAYDLLSNCENSSIMSKSKRGKLLHQIEGIISAIKYQKILPDIAEKLSNDDRVKKALNYFLLVDLNNKRGLVTDVLIKSKSLAEFILQDYIEERYTDLISNEDRKPKLNPEHPKAEKVSNYINESFKKRLGKKGDNSIAYDIRSILNILSFRDIIDCLEPNNQITPLVKPIIVLNDARNKVAHGLSEIDVRLVNNQKLNQLLASLKELLIMISTDDEEKFKYFNQKEFEYFDTKNKKLLELLN